MGQLLSTNVAQDVKSAEFIFNFNDTMINTSAAMDDFISSGVFDIVDLPANSIIVGGDVVTDTAFNAGTSYSIAVGDSGTADRYLASAARQAVGRSALVPTGYVNASGLPVRATIVLVGAAPTTGKMSVRVQYIVRGEANYVTG